MNKRRKLMWLWGGVTAPSSLLTGLVSYWTLEETSGTRGDSTATGNTLTDNNTVTQNPGKVGSAAQFTAANSESLSRADNVSLSTGDIDFTFAAWVYLDSLVNSTIVSKFNGGGNQAEYVLFFSHSDPSATDRFVFGVSSNGTAGAAVFRAASSFGLPSISTWYLVIGWHDSVANTINIQINNGTVDSTAHSAGVFDSATVFSIGILPGGVYPMNGRIDEVGFWKRVLTATERTALYNNGAGVTYPFVGNVPEPQLTEWYAAP